MPTQYEPKDHIQPLAIAPRAEGILDQREITIQSYQTTIPFDHDAINAGLERAWLTPSIPFGVFSRSPVTSVDRCAVVLGLQDSLSIRAYDYDARRPLYYAWKNAIVDTVGVRYFRDDAGLLRFTTTGGGRRITDDRLQEFNHTLLGIPKEAVTKRHFDLAKLRELCFSRFVDHLYMVRFSDPSGEEYRSIDHALFQSRQYIDPDAGRLQEVRADSQVKIESFDSDIDVRSDALAGQVQVRFFIRGLSGSLRLRFPKLTYKSQLATPEEQARVFYDIVDATVDSILDADYYAEHLHSLADLDTDLGMFPDMVDLSPFRDVFLNPKPRQEFFDTLDLSETWNEWQPHLRAIDELLPTADIAGHVKSLVGGLTSRDPMLATRLLVKCQEDAKTHRLGECVAGILASRLQSLPADSRPHVEEAVLAWAVARDGHSWDVNPDTGEITALGLRWQMTDLSLDVLQSVLWKLVGVVHDRLGSANGDAGSLLARFNWCMEIAKGLPLNPSKLPPALRLVTNRLVPHSLAEAGKVLKEQVADLRALDDAMLDQFGLPMWPCFLASGEKGKIKLENIGVGAAIGLRATTPGTLFGDDDSAEAPDLHPDESIVVVASGKPTTLGIRFSKFGRDYCLNLPVSYAKKVPTPPVKKQLKKRTQRDATVGALKRELHERILSLKSAIRSADDADKPFDLPRVTQKELAAAIKVGESSVSRAIAESKDMELKIMLQTVANPDMIRKYAR